jgi:hypothetical protein
VATAEHDPIRVDLAVGRRALRRPVAETDAAAGAGGVRRRDHAGAPRVGAGDERSRLGAREHAAVGPVEQLADTPGGGGLLGGALGGDEQRRHLLGGERDLGKVVPLLRDRVPLLDVPDVRRLHLEGDPVLAQHVLVALELALRGVEVLAAVRG